MTQVKLIRLALGLSQAGLGKQIERSQASVSAYEKGKDLPQRVAQQLVDIAGSNGLALTFDHVYGAATLPVIPAARSPRTV